ncbi:MAG: hypothetical protein ACKV22_22180 [Bryobacteraceae bacterium]
MRFLLLLPLLLFTTACFESPQVEENPYVPSYSNATVFKTVGTSDADVYELYLATRDSPDRVVKWYTSEFAQAGWKVNQSSGLGLMAVIAAEKPRRLVGVQVFEQGGRTVIHQSIKKKKRRGWW